MAIHRFWRKAKVKAPRRRRSAPVLPDTTGLSGTARRVNRVVAVVALFGAFGTLALAVALTPGAQTSASSATAPKEVAVSRIEVPPSTVTPAPVAAASMHTTVVKAVPEPAPKADRLFRALPAPEDRLEDSAAEPPRGAAQDETGERDVAMVDMADTADMPDTAESPKPAREAADSAARKLDEDAGRNLEFGLSEPPAPGDGEAAALDVEDAIEAAVEEEIDELSGEDAAEAAVEDEIAEEPVEEEVEAAIEPAPEEPESEPTEPDVAAPEPAEPKVAATRTAPVTTDVNMRAGPRNGAPVIQVVPGKSTVEVIGCDYWCEVIYDGKRGWIYKGFVRGS